jgi:hypothetical protein
MLLNKGFKDWIQTAVLTLATLVPAWIDESDRELYNKRPPIRERVCDMCGSSIRSILWPVKLLR